MSGTRRGRSGHRARAGAPRRGRRPAERREVDPGQPAVRQPGVDRARHAGGHARSHRARHRVAGPPLRPRRHRRIPPRCDGRRGARARPGRPGDRATPTSSCSSSTPRPGITEDDGVLATPAPPGHGAGARGREQGRHRRRTSPTRPSSTRSGSASPSRCPACTGARRATCSTASCSCCPTRRAKARGGRRRSRGSRSSAGRTSGSRACSTAWWGRSGRSCSRKPARPATRSTRSCRGPTDPCASSTRPACAGPRRSRGSSTSAWFGPPRRSSARTSAILVIDAEQGFAVEDKKIANVVLDDGRALMIVANKWDLVEEKDATYADLSATARQFASAPVMRASALSGRGVHRLPAVLLDLHARWTSRVPTSKVNEIIQQAQRERPTPRTAGNAALRDPGLDRSADVRGLRRRARARPLVPSVHREPAPAGVSPRGHPGAGAVPREEAALRGLAHDVVGRGLGTGQRSSGLAHASSRYNRDARDVAQSGSAPVWGTGGRGFKSRRPDRWTHLVTARRRRRACSRSPTSSRPSASR